MSKKQEPVECSLIVWLPATCVCGTSEDVELCGAANGWLEYKADCRDCGRTIRLQVQATP
jgi:hypothetical protein